MWTSPHLDSTYVFVSFRKPRIAHPQLDSVPIITATATKPMLFELRKQEPTRLEPSVASLILTPHTNTSLRHYALIWHERLQECGRALSNSDWSFLCNVVLPLLGSTPVKHLTSDPHLVNEALRTIETTYGISSAKRAHRLLRMMGRELALRRLAPYNPIESKSPGMRKSIGPRTLSPSQRALILQTSKSDPSLAPIGFLLETGATLGEVCRLTPADVDLQRALARINASPDEGRFSRTIPLSKGALSVIAYALAKNRTRSHVFLNKHNKPYTTETLRTRIVSMRVSTGIDHLTSRTLLHDFVVHAIRSRIDPVQLKDYLGLMHPDFVVAYWQSLPRYGIAPGVEDASSRKRLTPIALEKTHD